MRQLLLGLLFALVCSAAHAVCPSPLILQDANAVRANGLYTDDGSGNCMVNTAAIDGANKTLGAKGDAAWVSGAGSVVSILKSIATATTLNDPCRSAVKLTKAISVTTNTTQLISGVSAQKVYLCSVSLVATSATVANVIEGTGALCTTANEAAVIGSTVATTGMSLATNGVFVLGNGNATVGNTGTAANGVCLLQSTSTTIGGNLTYVQQ